MVSAVTRLWRAYAAECEQIAAGNADRLRRWHANAAGLRPEAIPMPPLPADLQGVKCGAVTRRGLPCKRMDLGAGGRCNFHGGASTGPRTSEGRARSLANLALGRVRRIGAGTPHGVPAAAKVEDR
jgi:hypothetical protein